MTMIRPVRETFDHLERQRQQFLEVLQGLTAAQLRFRPAADAWNVVAVGHHVVLAERGTAAAIRKHLGMRSSKRRLEHRLGYLLLWAVLKTGLRVKNPVPETAPDPDIDLARLIELWETTRRELSDVLSELSPRGLQYAAFKHPVAGPFTVEEALDFLVGHLDHHLRQVDRIRQDPSFPA